MKTLLILSLLFLSFYAGARDWYRIYLETKIHSLEGPSKFACSFCPPERGLMAVNNIIPHFERPKGAIFCRMEDYLTTKTKVWIKVGVK